MLSFGLKCPDFWSQPRKSIELLRRVSLPAVAAAQERRLGRAAWLWPPRHNGAIQGVMERGPWTVAVGPRELGGFGSGEQSGQCEAGERLLCPLALAHGDDTVAPALLCRSSTLRPSTFTSSFASAEVGAWCCAPIQAIGEGPPQQSCFFCHPRAQQLPQFRSVFRSL